MKPFVLSMKYPGFPVVEFRMINHRITHAGDPYCLDLRRNDTAVFWAEHGAGTWDFQPAFDCLEDFLESVLDVPKTQEYETAYPYHYIRLIVTGISDTKKAMLF